MPCTLNIVKHTAIRIITIQRICIIISRSKFISCSAFYRIERFIEDGITKVINTDGLNKNHITAYNTYCQTGI